MATNDTRAATSPAAQGTQPPSRPEPPELVDDAENEADLGTRLSFPASDPPASWAGPDRPPQNHRRFPAQAQQTTATSARDAGTSAAVRFAFAFDDRLRPVAALFGVRPGRAWVEVSAHEVSIRFGPWWLRTPRANVAGAEVTGPYRWWKVAGPARLSPADRGVTFATSTRRGVCLTFHQPVPAIAPGGWLRHPAATVTVAEPERLLEALDAPARRAQRGASGPRKTWPG